MWRRFENLAKLNIAAEIQRSENLTKLDIAAQTQGSRLLSNVMVSIAIQKAQQKAGNTYQGYTRSIIGRVGANRISGTRKAAKWGIIPLLSSVTCPPYVPQMLRKPEKI